MARYAFSLIGGDLRIAWLAQQLTHDGHIVKLYGQEENDFAFENTIIHCCDLETAISNSDAVILGIPCTRDSKTVFTPYTRRKIPFNDLLSTMDDTQYLFGGIVPFIRKNTIDYSRDESFLWANSIPTAEGALQLLMQHSPCVVTGSQIAILGFGRIAQKTAQLLSSIGASVAVYARSTIARAQASAMGFTTKKLDDIHQDIQQYDAILNTVPAIIVHSNILADAKKDTLFMELASAPGGYDKNAINQYHLSYIHASGLPGKVAPKTAAQYIKNAILNRLEELL